MENSPQKHPPFEQHTAPNAPQAPLPPTQKEVQKTSFFGEIFRFVFLALIIVLPIRLFIAQPFIVSGASMEETFQTGQYLIVDQVTYHFEDPQRGDVIIFRYPKDPSKFFIKRVIGIPGDTVLIKGDVVTLLNKEIPDGVALDEPYIRPMSPQVTPIVKILGSDEYFVMGDNRDESSDSRVWGTVPRENIVGRAYLRLLPVTTAGILPGEYNIDSELQTTK